MVLARAGRRLRATGPVRGPRRARSRSRHRLRAPLIALGVVVLLLAVDAAWVGTTAAREAKHIQERLTAGADLLEQGRVEQAATRFVLADRAADSLDTALAHPAAVLAGIVPWLSDDADAARALSDASEEVARAGVALTRAASDAGWDGATVPGLGPAGHIDTAAITEASPDIRTAADATETAHELLAPIRADSLIGPLRDAVVQARAELNDRGPTLRRAALMAELLPSFFGQEGRRRYLLIAQNLSDPRGSGGHVGSHAILKADAGRLSLGRIQTTVDLGTGPPADAPPDVEARYEMFGSLDRPMATTYPPDFATAARLLVGQWEARDERPVDGVISIDAVWMADVLGAIGSVETPLWPSPIDTGNAVEVLGRDTFLLPDQDASNAAQGALAAALWQAMLERRPEARPFGEAMAKGARERHLQVYSTHREEQALLEELGAAGRVPESDNPLQVTWFGATDSRAGYFVEKEVEYHAVLSPDGWADVTVAATLHNRAPDRPPSILLGDAAGFPVGYFQAYANVYLPTGGRVLGWEGGSFTDDEKEEDGAPVVMGLIGAGSGRSVTFTVRYRADGVVENEGGAGRFSLDVLPQPALRPDTVRVLVELPTGVEVLGTSPGAAVEGGALRWEGTPTTPEHVWVRFR